MSAAVPEMVGALAACAGAGGALVLADPRARYLAIGVGLAAAAALLAGQVWDEPRFADLIREPAAIVLAAVLGGTALAATAATFNRVPAAFAIAAFAVLPLRLPVQIGDETNFLLVPLYGVIAGGFIRGAWLCARGRAGELQIPSAPSVAEPAVVRLLCWALGASLVAYAIGVAWSDDPENAIRTVAFFLVPFAALLALLRDVPWHRRLLGHVLAATVIVAAGFAAIALYQHASHELLLNKDLKDANQLHLYFRVNSLFRDPNVFGRYLVFAIVGLAAWIAWRRSVPQAVGGALVAALLLVALALTYSQTSYAALVAALSVLVWLRLGLPGLAVAVALGLAGIATVALIGGPDADTTVDSGRSDLAESSSGRSSLIEGGAELWQAQPLVGQGSGSFATAFRREVEPVKRPVSHTEPITVAAEQGALGLIFYLAVLGLSLALFLRPRPGRGAGAASRAGVAAVYVALLVHSLGYAGFLTDPATWALLALGIILRE